MGSNPTPSGYGSIVIGYFFFVWACSLGGMVDAVDSKSISF